MIDIYISAKNRKNRSAGFGFVRYGSLHEARTAIDKVNGLAVKGRNLLVSMARYEKGGAPVRKTPLPVGKKVTDAKKKWYPSNRDCRSYSDVVLGLKNKLENLEMRVEKKNNVIPAIFSLNVAENSKIASMLSTSIIAENT